MPFPPAFIDEVIARNPIEDVVGQYVTLKRSGSNLFGLCPFHGEKTASFSVAPDKGMFYCFGCHKGGGVINFEMEIEGLSYGDAVRALAKRAGLEVPEDEQYQSRYRQQERLWALHKEAARFSTAACTHLWARRHWNTHGAGNVPDDPDEIWHRLRPGQLERSGGRHAEKGLHRSGAAGLRPCDGVQKERQSFRPVPGSADVPIIDVRGNVIGFSGRIMNDRDKNAAKYLNSRKP